MILYKQQTEVTFANETITFAANTVKLNAKVNNWPFTSTSNMLQISFNFSFPLNFDALDQNGSVVWLQINAGGIELYPFL